MKNNANLFFQKISNVLDILGFIEEYDYEWVSKNLHYQNAVIAFYLTKEKLIEICQSIENSTKLNNTNLLLKAKVIELNNDIYAIEFNNI